MDRKVMLNTHIPCSTTYKGVDYSTLCPSEDILHCDCCRGDIRQGVYLLGFIHTETGEFTHLPVRLCIPCMRTVHISRGDRLKLMYLGVI